MSNIIEEQQNLNAEQATQAQNQKIEFRKAETTILGPLNINIKPKEDNAMPKGLDLLVPMISFATEIKVFLQVNFKANQESNEIKPIFININQDIETAMIPEQNSVMRLSVKFNENFYEKYKNLIGQNKETNNLNPFNLMTYIQALIEPTNI